MGICELLKPLCPALSCAEWSLRQDLRRRWKGPAGAIGIGIGDFMALTSSLLYLMMKGILSAQFFWQNFFFNFYLVCVCTGAIRKLSLWISSFMVCRLQGLNSEDGTQVIRLSGQSLTRGAIPLTPVLLPSLYFSPCRMGLENVNFRQVWRHTAVTPTFWEAEAGGLL